MSTYFVVYKFIKFIKFINKIFQIVPIEVQHLFVKNISLKEQKKSKNSWCKLSSTMVCKG